MHHCLFRVIRTLGYRARTVWFRQCSYRPRGGLLAVCLHVSHESVQLCSKSMAEQTQRAFPKTILTGHLPRSRRLHNCTVHDLRRILDYSRQRRRYQIYKDDDDCLRWSIRAGAVADAGIKRYWRSVQPLPQNNPRRLGLDSTKRGLAAFDRITTT